MSTHDTEAVQVLRERFKYFCDKHATAGRFKALWKQKEDRALERLRQLIRDDQDQDSD